MTNQSKLLRASISAFTAFLLALSAAPAVAIPMPNALPIPENRLAPVQHRVAFAGEDGIAVSWNTYTKLGQPQVFYGTNPDQLNKIASSQISQTYATSTTYSNHVKLSGLEPNTTYYYKVSNSPDGYPAYSFTTPPTSESNKFDSFKFAMAIDLGTMGPLGLSETTGDGDGGILLPGERNTIEALAANKDDFEFMWHPGDIAYADYWLKEELHGYLPLNISNGYQVYESILNKFYEDISSIASYKPYMVGPGNHEANCDNGGAKDKKNDISYTVSLCIPGQTNFTGYQSHWRMPSEESGGNTNMWYSYNWGPVHFVQIDTETDLGNGITGPDEGKKMLGGPFGSYTNEQFDWLNKDLASVDRCKTPWVIVAGHRPWYTVNSDSICDTCQSAFEATLIKYNVDVAVFGHVHNYQRWDPMSNNEVDPNGLNNPLAPWYLVNGAAGHYDGMDALDNDANPAGFKFGFDNTYGWSRFTVHNETHITHEFVASRNDSVMDTATLFKKHDLSSCAVPDTSSSALPSTSSATSTSSASSLATSTVISNTTSTFISSSAATTTSSHASGGSALSSIATTSPIITNNTAISSSRAVSSSAATSSGSTYNTKIATNSISAAATFTSPVKSFEIGSSTGTVTVSCHTCKDSSASGVSTSAVTEFITGTLTDIFTSTATIPCHSCKESVIASGSKSGAASESNVASSAAIDTITVPCHSCSGIGATTETGNIVIVSGSDVTNTITASCSTSTGVSNAPATTETLTVSCHTCKEASSESAVSISPSSSVAASVPIGIETVTVSCHTCTATGSSVGSTPSVSGESSNVLSGTIPKSSDVEIKTVTLSGSAAVSSASGASSNSAGTETQTVTIFATSTNSVGSGSGSSVVSGSAQTETEIKTKTLTLSGTSTINSSGVQPSASPNPQTTVSASNSTTVTSGTQHSTLSTLNNTSVSAPVQVAPSATLEQTNDAASKTTMLHSSIMGAIVLAFFYIAF